jgi:asparagine synthase (glutamine-hydrolysing)
MAAIYGFVATETISADETKTLSLGMQRRLAHRAPDGFTHWAREGAWLGHGAMHLGAPPSGSTQPLRLEDGRILVVDGFVANDQDLRQRLGVPPMQVLDDAQLIALALQRWQERFTDHLHGEFALALWDPRARTLDLWRDHLGARPMCYLQTRRGFGFASEAPPLLLVPEAPRRVNPLAFVTMWCDDANYQDLASTPFEGILALPPAHHLRLQEEGVASLRRYWRLQPAEPLRLPDEGQYVDAFREVFAAAVDRSMRHAERTGLMLSGGIDSGAILAARRGFRKGVRAEGLLCLSAVAGAGVVDAGLHAESANIRSMTADEPDAVRFEVPAPVDNPLVSERDVVELAMARPHPVDMYLQVSAHACRLARERGCRLVLNGIDGDNVLGRGAYPMAELLRQGEWRRAWRECRQNQNSTYLHRMSPTQVMGHALYHAFAPDLVRRWRGQRHARRMLAGLRRHPVLAPDLVDRLGLAERIEWAVQRRYRRDPQHRCDHRSYWLAFSMRGAEHVAARNGTAIRFPWCDKRVVAFFEGVPTRYLACGGWTKYLVRKGCEPALGESAVWHIGKRHLGELLNRQVLQLAGTRLAAVLDAERTGLQAFFRPAAVDQAKATLAGFQCAATSRYDTVLAMACMAGWLRQAQDLLARE